MARKMPATVKLVPRDSEEHLGDRRIRVVHCIDGFGAGGTELNLVRTLERLDQRRFDLSLIALSETGPLRARVEKAGITVHLFCFPSLRSFTAFWRAVALIRWFRRVRPDVVHCHDRYTNLFVTPCARIAGVPLIITSRRWWTAMPHWIYKVGNQFAYRLSHRVLTNSPAGARLMSESEGVARSKIVIVPNFVDDEAFETLPIADRLKARLSFGIPNEALVITAVAVFRPEKDLETLIRAATLLRSRHPDVHVLLVGNGPCTAALRTAAAVHAVADRIHFSGFLASPPNPHQYGDITVLCSLHEGFPNSIIEAMAAGRPVVATAVGGIPDAVQDGITGFLVPAGSPPDLAAALENLIEDEGLRRRMGSVAREKARTAFGAQSVIERLSEIYRNYQATN